MPLKNELIVHGTVTTQGIAIFLGTKYQHAKIYQMTSKLSKWPKNISTFSIQRTSKI
jgi:hypothetical protein